MTSYTFELTMEAALTGQGDGSGYPLQKNTDNYDSSQIHSTWMHVPNEDNHNTSNDHNYADTLVSGEVSMYCKHGDTIKCKVTNPNSGSTDELVTVGFNHVDGFAEPNPTSVSDPGGNTSVIGWCDDGATYSLGVLNTQTGWAVQYDTTTSTVSGAVNNSTSVTLSASNSGIEVDDVVTGTGISGTVSVSAISGTSLTLSSAQTISNGVTLTFTRTMLSPARQVTWMYHGPPASGGAWSNSARATFRLVSADLTGSSTSLVQGYTNTFTATNIAGLMPSSGDRHNLYVVIRDISGNVVTTTGASGVSWDNSVSGYSYIGKIPHTTDTNVVLTVGSSMTAGTYTAQLCHFNSSHQVSNSTSVGNRFYNGGVLDTHTFSVISSSGTVSFTGVGADVTTDELSFEVERNTGVVVCTPSSYQPQISVGGGAKYRRRDYNWDYHDAAGGVTTTQTMYHGWDADFFLTGPDGYNDSVTGSITIGEDTDYLTITTNPEPGTEGDGGGAGTAVDWGLEVTNGSNSVIFGSNLKSGHEIASASISTNLGSGSWSAYYTLPVLHADNIPEKIAIIVIDMYTGSDAVMPAWVVERHSTADSNGFGRWRVKNYSGIARPYRYIVVRY